METRHRGLNLLLLLLISKMRSCEEIFLCEEEEEGTEEDMLNKAFLRDSVDDSKMLKRFDVAFVDCCCTRTLPRRSMTSSSMTLIVSTLSKS